MLCCGYGNYWAPITFYGNIIVYLCNTLKCPVISQCLGMCWTQHNTPSNSFCQGFGVRLQGFGGDEKVAACENIFPAVSFLFNFAPEVGGDIGCDGVTALCRGLRVMGKSGEATCAWKDGGRGQGQQQAPSVICHKTARFIWQAISLWVHKHVMHSV